MYGIIKSLRKVAIGVKVLSHCTCESRKKGSLEKKSPRKKVAVDLHFHMEKKVRQKL